MHGDEQRCLVALGELAPLVQLDERVGVARQKTL
jgi:hypothetical protein